MLVSYHNHTTWSDGSASVPELVAAGRAAGLDELGISDHYALFPDGRQTHWSLPVERLADYVAELREAAEGSERPVVRVGIEADFFPETVAELRRRLEQHPFDFVLGSVHVVGDFPVHSAPRAWDALGEDGRHAVCRGYWDRVRQLAESRAFDVAAHLDLFKKTGYHWTADLSSEAGAALDAIAAADMAIEINTNGWNVPVREAYPSLALLREARRRGIPLLISADAHFPEHLTRDFDRARALAREAGYTELVRYEKRKRLPIPLENSPQRHRGTEKKGD